MYWHGGEIEGKIDNSFHSMVSWIAFLPSKSPAEPKTSTVTHSNSDRIAVTIIYEMDIE